MVGFRFDISDRTSSASGGGDPHDRYVSGSDFFGSGASLPEPFDFGVLRGTDGRNLRRP